MSKFTKGIFYSILLTAGSIPAVSADEVFHEAVNQSLPFWSVIPFVVMLFAVAFVPLINGLWWAKNTKWVSLGCALFFLIPFSYAYGVSEGIYRLLESILLDFIPFIVLLYGLYATAGRHYDPWQACRDADHQFVDPFRGYGHGKLDRHDGCGYAFHPSIDPCQ